MKRQQAATRVERPFRRRGDVAFMQVRPVGERPQRTDRELQHFGGWIDTDETPARLRIGERTQFQTPAGTDYQDSPIGRRRLRQEQARHLLQVTKAGHHARRILGVARDGLRIVEAVHGRSRAPCAASMTRLRCAATPAITPAADASVALYISVAASPAANTPGSLVCCIGSTLT